MKSGNATERTKVLGDLIRGILAFVVCSLLCIAVVASDAAVARAEGRNGMQSSERVVSHLKDRLNLTDDQVNKILPIIEQNMQKQAELREQMLQLRRSTDEKIKSVLTPEQSKEFQQLRDQRLERMRSRMQRPGGPSEDQH